MNIETDRTKVVFKNTKDNKEYFSIGLSKKDKDGNYINGYINCRFPKDAKLENKTRIRILEAWLDFYVKDKITYPYIFINKYETIEDGKVIYEIEPKKTSSEYDNENSDVQIKDEDLPF